jgi:hypothetical protein
MTAKILLKHLLEHFQRLLKEEQAAPTDHSTEDDYRRGHLDATKESLRLIHTLIALEASG